MDEKRKNTIRRRYNRLAFFYDFMEALPERFLLRSWRMRLQGRIYGYKVLEAGGGTGKNFPFYPLKTQITAIDFSPRMLKRAQKKAPGLGLEADILEMDVQDLIFPDNTFDTVLATFVFCSVPNPVLGLQELRRVCKPGGRLLLLEHMRPENLFKGMLFDILNPLVVRMMGANINRRTVENIGEAGWKIQVEKNLFSDVVRWIEAEP